MTTFTDFLPTATAPFQFAPTLDGAQYTLVVTWNVAGQRWYCNLYDQNNTLIFYLPLIASGNPIATLSLTWDGTRRIVNITTITPHGLTIGAIVTMTNTGITPSAYNGTFDMIVSGPITLTYQQATDPGGDATIQGTVGRDINIAAGYFVTSTLVFRGATQQFEVSP